MRRLILLSLCLMLCGFALWAQPPVLAPTSLSNAVLGTAYSQTLTVSSGGYPGGTLTYSLASGALPPGINLTSSAACNFQCGIVAGTPTAAGTYNFTVQVDSNLSGAVTLTGTQAYTIVVYPVLAITTASAPSGVLGVPYSKTFSATGGGGPSTYVWATLTAPPPTGVTMSSAGVLAGTPTATGFYSFSVQVSSQIPNFGTVTAINSFTVGIAATNVAIAGNLPASIAGSAYSASLATTGGFTQGTNTFSVISGTPPSGTTLSAGGTLSGVLTAAGTYNFTVQVTNQPTFNGVPQPQPLVATQAFSVVIYPVLAITTASASPGTVNVPYSQTFTATGGAGASTYTWNTLTATPPPGLTLSAAGVLAGTPTTAGSYTFSVQVSSQVPGFGTAVAIQPFTVVINATPPPAITGSLGSGVTGSPYSGTLGATGGYGSGTYTFSLVSGTTPSGTTLSAGGTLSGILTAAGTFTFSVQVTSTFPSLGAFPPLTATQPFTVIVYPGLTITTQTANPGTVGVSYSQTFAATGGAPSSAYTWSLQGGTPPPGLTMSAAGVLSGTPTAAGSFSIYVQVSSQIPGGVAQTASQWFTVVVSATPTVTITGSLGVGTIGVPYFAALTAAGGYSGGTYTFSLASGTLPAGLSLSASGTVSGTPTAVGSSTFTVQVTDTYPSTAASFPTLTGTQSFTVAVNPVLTITTVAVSPGTLGAPYSLAFTATGGGGPSTYTWSSAGGTLPPGLTLSAAGVLSGTPTSAGSFNFSVQVSSQSAGGSAQTATQGFNMPVGTAASLSISGTLSGGTLGVPYSGTLTGFGGYPAGTYTFSLATGALPTGITLAAGGTLSGTPTVVGTFAFTIQVSNTYTSTAVLPPLTATQSYTVTIYPALAITTTTASSGTVGTAYSQTFAAIGGAGVSTYVWSVATGAPPPGLTFSAAGVLSGTPTAAGTFSFSVEVSSQVPTIGAQTASQAFSVVIAPVPPLTITGTLGAGTASAAYSATLGATGGYGAGTYTFSVVSGTLPTGTTLSAGGVLSGTPTGTGSFTFTVQVTSALTTSVANILPLTATQSFTVVVTGVALTITGSPGSGTVGVPYAAALTGSGGYGTGTYTFSLVSGNLPANIALSSGGILSGTPTAVGTSTFTVQVTSTQTGQPLTATQSFTIAVGLAPAPPLTISGLPNTLAPGTQPAVGVTAGNPYPIAIQGTITLTFAPTSGPDDPSVQFTTGGRTVTFQIPAGASQAEFVPITPGLQTGTVAGTITLTLTLTAASVNITPTPAPTQVLVVAKSAPVITSATVAATSGGFNLLVVGFSTTRDMVSAGVTFNPASGITLANNSATVSLSQVFTAWYQSATSAPFGSMFSLEIPFTIQNGSNPLASVSVTLTNSQGTSATATAAF